MSPFEPLRPQLIPPRRLIGFALGVLIIVAALANLLAVATR
jgi:hypothetical protein